MALPPSRSGAGRGETPKALASVGADRHPVRGPNPLWILLLLSAANTAPLFATRYLGGRWNARIDAGISLADGRPLLGASKTWRGVGASIAGSLVAGRLFGIRPAVALRLSLAAMAGDLIASFAKRRVGIEPHGRSPVLDRLPESLLPLVLMRRRLRLRLDDSLVILLAFGLMEEPLSRLFFALGLRDRPY
jgi:CDP-2,3-bis-(O-geranylgeranyl)-sn-glycerol synthase